MYSTAQLYQTPTDKITELLPVIVIKGTIGMKLCARSTVLTWPTQLESPTHQILVFVFPDTFGTPRSPSVSSIAQTLQMLLPITEQMPAIVLLGQSGMDLNVF